MPGRTRTAGLDTDVYPFLPRTTVEKTFARAYLSLLSDQQEAA
ncbi:hypothetical protein [Novosphingobium decolorationis]|nr:hypothetical protein [Novosphingobium decolorationis]